MAMDSDSNITLGLHHNNKENSQIYKGRGYLVHTGKQPFEVSGTRQIYGKIRDVSCIKHLDTCHQITLH